MEGIVNILKPPGMTSSNVVSDVRRLFSIKRVGHTGTLDPGAAGVLPVCLGRATRLFDYLADKQKEYIAEISFGAATDTQDSYGCVLSRDTRIVEQEELCHALRSFLGKQQQIAPAFSALKVQGKAYYQIAREGGEVPERIRDIAIFDIRLLNKTAENRYLISVQCSRGTYVRTLAQDIGKKLNTLAHLSFLLRTASGIFNIANAFTLYELEQLKLQNSLDEAVMPVEQALLHLPALYLHEADEIKRLKNGCAIRHKIINETERYSRIYDTAFLGIGETVDGGIKLKIHFKETE